MSSAKGDRSAQLAISSDRSRDLNALLDDYEHLHRDDLSFADLLSLTNAAELVRKYDKCIEFGQLCLSKDSSRSEPYYPLIRSLVNVDRLDEGERILRHAYSVVKKPTDVHSLHAVLAAKLLGIGQRTRGEQHVRLLLDHEFDSYNTSVNDIDPLRSLSFLNTFVQPTEPRAELLATEGRLALYLRTVNAQLEKQRRAQQELSSPKQVIEVSHLFRLTIQLRLLNGSDDVAAQYSKWIDFLATKVTRDELRSTSKSELSRLFNDIPDSSHTWGTTDDLQNVLPPIVGRCNEVTRTDPRSAKELSGVVAACSVLDGIIRQHQLQQTLIGKPAPSDEELMWVSAERKSTDQNGVPKVIVIWHPLSKNCANLFGELTKWESRLRSRNVDFGMTVVSPYCGLTWDRQHGKYVAKRVVERKTEVDTVSRFLGAVGYHGAAALAEPDSRFLHHFDASFFPIFVAIDRDNTLKCIVTGCEREKLKYFFSRVE